MKIIIELDEKYYNDIKEAPTASSYSVLHTLMGVRNGTPLPKGHGRLGDLDELEQRISNFVEHDATITDEYTVTRQRFIVDGIKQTPTIIEAESEV